MVRQKVPQIPDPHCLKEPAVQPQDVVEACTQQSVFPYLELRLQVVESQELAEVPEDIHQPELHQEVGNFLDSGVLGHPYVSIKVSHNNGVLVPEADQGLLQV